MYFYVYFFSNQRVFKLICFLLFWRFLLVFLQIQVHYQVVCCIILLVWLKLGTYIYRWIYINNTQYYFKKQIYRHYTDIHQTRKKYIIGIWKKKIGGHKSHPYNLHGQKWIQGRCKPKTLRMLVPVPHPQERSATNRRNENDIELRKIHRHFGWVGPTRQSFFKDHRIQGLKFLSDSTLIDMNHVLIISVILFTSSSGQGYTFTRSHYAMK